MNSEANSVKAHYDLTGDTRWAEGAIYMAETIMSGYAHHAPKWVKVSPFIAMLIGFFTAMWFYHLEPKLAGNVGCKPAAIYSFLLNKWYFDEIL